MITNCQLLLQSISDAILMLDKDGYIVYSNAAASHMTGYAESELLNKPVYTLYNDTEDNIKAEYELSLAKKNGKFVVEGWRTKKDNSKFWGEMTFSCINNDQNDSAGFSCQIRDLTAKKQTEIELIQSEERFRLMVESVIDYAIFMLDATGHILTWNEGAKRLKGYSANEIKGKHFSTFYTSKDLADGKPERELKIAIATGKYEEEGWRVKKNGSVFWANIVITSLFNDKNKLIGFSKVTRDLTERKENEENLRQSEERYRSLVEQVTDYGIFMLDEKGIIISWNEGAKNIKGYTADEIIGKYFSIFYTEEDIINGKPGYELRVAKQAGKYEEEGWRVKKDGSLFWANVIITALYNEGNILIGYSKVTRDLTERKKSERALRESYENYRRIANELKITNTDLSYANHELEQFTSIVSHDLQEPVRSIKSFLQLIDMKLKDGQTSDLNTYISKSIKAANRMKELIQNLLHYSQLSKEQVLEEEISVNELIHSVLQNLNNAIETSGAQITIENSVDTIRGDQVQLEQLVQNLISNALKFTDRERPRIIIRCFREKNTVKFEISDNGIGISGDDMDKVFEIFKRLYTKKDYPGTGIGLAICKKIVDRHGGKIWADSEPGKGTTFHFTLHEEIKEMALL